LHTSRVHNAYHRRRLCSRTFPRSSCHAAGRATITNGAFAHLAGVHTLDTSRCNQAAITDAAFAHLAGIRTLDMRACGQVTVKAVQGLVKRGVHVLA